MNVLWWKCARQTALSIQKLKTKTKIGVERQNGTGMHNTHANALFVVLYNLSQREVSKS